MKTCQKMQSFGENIGCAWAGLKHSHLTGTNSVTSPCFNGGASGDGGIYVVPNLAGWHGIHQNPREPSIVDQVLYL